MIGAEMILKCGQVLYANVRHKGLFGGRAGGKSWAVATYLILRALQSRKRIVCARQFQNSIRDSSKELLEKRIRDLGLADQFSITHQSIQHDETGSNFLFVGLERNIESIRSLEGADSIWIEEANTISAYSMEILLPTIRAPDSELIWVWNPKLPTDPVDAFFRSGDPPPNSQCAKVNYTDNKFFANTALRGEMEMMRKHNFARYRHIWEGDYDVSYESKVFTNVTIGRPEVPSSARPFYGMDFGFSSDPSAIVQVYVIGPTRQIYIANEVVGRVPMDQLPGLIDSIVPNRGDLIRCDSSQPGTIEFLKSRGFGVVGARKGPGSVREGIQLLQGYSLVIDPNCETARREVHGYSWPTDRLTGQVISGTNPVGGADHIIDATRYALDDLIVDSPLDDDDTGVLWLDPWSRQPHLHRAEPPGEPVPRGELSYKPLPPRPRRVD